MTENSVNLNIRKLSDVWNASEMEMGLLNFKYTKKYHKSSPLRVVHHIPCLLKSNDLCEEQTETEVVIHHHFYKF